MRDLGQLGYRPVASVEHEIRKRLSTVRLASPQGITVDLLFASCGIEGEISLKATPVDLPPVGSVRVARAEDLLAMKILSMREARLQDRIDAQRLLEFVPELDLVDVRRSLQTIAERGYDRNQDLPAKLAALLDAVARRG